MLVRGEYSEYNFQGTLHSNKQFRKQFFEKQWRGIIVLKAWRRFGDHERGSEDSGHPRRGAVLLAPFQMLGFSGSGTQKAVNLKDEMRRR